MKLNFNDFRRKCQFPLLLAAGTLPVTLILVALAVSDMLYLAWAFAGAYVLLTCIGIVIPGKYRLHFGIGASVLIFGVSYYLSSSLQGPGLNVVGIIYIVLLMLSLRIGGWTWSQEVPEFCYWGGLAIHIATQVILILAVDWKAYAVLSTADHTVAAFFIFIVFALLSMTRNSMIFASMGRHRASANMRRKNTMMIMGFFALILILTLATSPAVANAVQAIWAFVLYLKALLEQVGQTETIPTETTEPEATIGTNELLNSEPSDFFKWLEALFMTIFDFLLMIAIPLLGILILGVIVFLLYKLLRYLLSRFSSFANAASDDYEDVITDTRDAGQKVSLSQRLKNSAAFVDERKLSPGERIRHRYRRLLKKHPEWAKSTTARENLPDEMAPFYEKARYSDKTLTKEDADQFTAGIKDV